MRVFHPLLLGASLSLAPAVSFASTTDVTPSRASSSAPVLQTAAKPSPSAAPSQAPQRARTDEQRYAAREQSSPEAAAYRGGDTLVIGASAATAILAVVLLVVLL